MQDETVLAFEVKLLANAKKDRPHMNLTESKVEQKCAQVADLIDAGQFNEAREELGELWPGLGEPPQLKFSPLVNAELLLQCGTLTGWLTSAQRIYIQGKAKNLITEALKIFKSLNNQQKMAEAQYELGMCYWRTGAFDEARTMLHQAMQTGAQEQRGKVLVRQTLVEISSGRYHEALEMLNSSRLAFESYSHALKGRWHEQKALVLQKLASIESRPDYDEQAIAEYTAASIHLEQAGHHRYLGNCLSNLAFLLSKTGHYREAHDSLDKARIIFEKLKDPHHLAQIDEMRARILLAEERYQEAEVVINEVIHALGKDEEQELHTDALTTKATILARLEHTRGSITTFEQAIRMGEQAGVQSHAGHAAMGLIEEHGKNMTVHEIYNAYRRADRLLTRLQDLESINRLRLCARIFVARLCERSAEFSLKDALLEYEAHFIEQALEEEQGSITRASIKLGTTHQGLDFILGNRQQQLLSKRTPRRNRRRSIIKKRGK